MAARQTSVSEPVSGVHVSRSREEDRSLWRVAADPGLWSTELDWFLNCAASALGDRGTLAAVISAIERGGGRNSASYDQHTDEQVAWLRPRDWGTVQRARRLQTTWRRVPLRHRAVLLRHYLNGSRCSSKVHARFGVLSGVAAALWCEDLKARRVVAAESKLAQLEADRVDLLGELRRVEDARSAYLAGVTLVRGKRARHEPTDPVHAFRMLSSAWFHGRAARALRSRHAEVMRQVAERVASSERQDALSLLENACERGELPDLRRRADRMVREAHRVWDEARAAVEAEDL